MYIVLHLSAYFVFFFIVRSVLISWHIVTLSQANHFYWKKNFKKIIYKQKLIFKTQWTNEIKKVLSSPDRIFKLVDMSGFLRIDRYDVSQSHISSNNSDKIIDCSVWNKARRGTFRWRETDGQWVLYFSSLWQIIFSTISKFQGLKAKGYVIANNGSLSGFLRKWFDDGIYPDWQALPVK